MTQGPPGPVDSPRALMVILAQVREVLESGLDAAQRRDAPSALAMLHQLRAIEARLSRLSPPAGKP